MNNFMVLGFLLSICGGALSHTYHLGACPKVEPMPGFEMNRMLGLWYVLQKTSTASSCITYNFTRSLRPGHYDVEQVSQHFILGLTPLKHDLKYTGTLSIPDRSVPALMRVRFPMNLAGYATYTVLDTDYDTYAGVFTCQKFGFAHRRSASILSRQKELNQSYIEKIRTKLSEYGVDPYDLSIIDHSECPSAVTRRTNNGTDDEEYEPLNINISETETMTNNSLHEAVKNTREYLASGIKFVVNASKTMYNKIKDLDKTARREKSWNDDAPFRRPFDSPPKSDAEWLP